MELNLYEINEFNKELKSLNENLKNEDNKKVYEYAQKRAEELKEELKEIQIHQIQADGNLTAEEWSKKDFLEKEIAKNQEKISAYEENQKDTDKKILKKRLEKEDLNRELNLEEAKLEIELSKLQKKWNNAIAEQNENREKIKQLRLANRDLEENSQEAQKNLEEILELQNKNEELTKVMQENAITSKKGMELKKQLEDIKAMKNILESGTVLEGIKNPKATEKEKPVEEKPVEEKPVEEKPVEEKPVEEKPAQEKPAQEKPVEEKPVEEKPVEEKPVEEKPVEEKPVEEKPVEEKPVEEKPIEEKPVEEKPVEEKPVEDKTEEEKDENKPLDIKISAKDKVVYVNGELLQTRIKKILRDKLEIDNDELKDILKTNNPFKVWNVKRKIDPVIIEVLAQKGRIGDYTNYIKAIQEGVLSEKNNLHIEYDLKDSTFSKDTDKKLQKYARHADKVEGIYVEGLKERGPKAWFKAFMDKVKTLSLPEGKEKEIDMETKATGFKGLDQTAIKLQQENENEKRIKPQKIKGDKFRNMTEEDKELAEQIAEARNESGFKRMARNEENVQEEIVKQEEYAKGNLSRFLESYEQLKDEEGFDLKFFMQKAAEDLSKEEYTNLGVVITGNKARRGLNIIDKQAEKLQKENEQELKEKTTKSSRTAEGKEWAKTIDARKYVRSNKKFKSPENEYESAINRGIINVEVSKAKKASDGLEK